MSRFLLYVVIIFSSLRSYSQNPLVKMWDKRFGGTDYDRLSCFQQTSDGGYLLGGWSNSGAGGDKTQSNYQGGSNNFDYWIVKVDSLGNKQWDKTYGGTEDDYLRDIEQTPDGGYILGGYSASGISGDKTVPNWDVTLFSTDFWVIKIDAAGNKLWDKGYGGTGYDALFSLQVTSDGGFIFGGHSNSMIGGDKTDSLRGGYDYWMVKTDAMGNKSWDKSLGGTGHDYFQIIQQTQDGGFILGGDSWSGIGGDKTGATKGYNDYWIIKTDSVGNRQWDKDFGGNGYDYMTSLDQTSQGEYIFGGSSYSNIGGDKTQARWGGYDFWIIKTDAAGNKLWDKDFGGTDEEEEFGNIFQTPDGGFVMAGGSLSDISGNKTENNLGGAQSWVLKIDSLGNIQWDKTIFTIGYDDVGWVIETANGEYTFANFGTGGVGGYKTQPNWGTWGDYWIVKFYTVLQSNFTGPSLLCNQNCLDFTNLSTNAVSYLWSFPGATPDTSTAACPQNICYPGPGSYDVQLIAYNATDSDTLLLPGFVNVFPPPAPQSIIQHGDTLVANQGAASYQWYFNGNAIAGATHYFYVALSSGDYNVIATDVNGCEAEAVIFNVIAGISDESLIVPVLFPNPATSEILVNLEGYTGKNLRIAVYNSLGEKKSEQDQFTSNPVSIHIESFQPGPYVVEISVGEKIIRSIFIKHIP